MPAHKPTTPRSMMVAGVDGAVSRRVLHVELTKVRKIDGHPQKAGGAPANFHPVPGWPGVLLLHRGYPAFASATKFATEEVPTRSVDFSERGCLLGMEAIRSRKLFSNVLSVSAESFI